MITRNTLLAWAAMGLVLMGGVMPAADDSATQPLNVKEKLVDVEGCRLYFTWIPGNDTIVLLEAGGGMDSTEWKQIAATVARKTGATVLSYDRAGFGQSDLPDPPCRMDVETRWLHTGLERLGLGKNLVLVGHSYGGWMIRLFASMYPEQVRGMVFVDPFSVELVDLLGVDYLDNHPMAGKLPFDTSHPEKLNKFQKAAVRMVGDGLGPKVKLMRKAVLPKGIPIRLITSRQRFMPQMNEQEAWWKAHQQIAAGNPDIVLVEATKSGHMVPITEPDLIIDQIAEVIQESKR